MQFMLFQILSHKQMTKENRERLYKHFIDLGMVNKSAEMLKRHPELSKVDVSKDNSEAPNTKSKPKKAVKGS